MVEATVCKSCSTPMATGFAFCPGCGAPTDTPESAIESEATAAPAEAAGGTADGEADAPAPGASAPEDPRLAALRLDPSSAQAPAPQPAAAAVVVDDARRNSARDSAVKAAAAARAAAARAAAEKAAAARAAAARAAAEKAAAVNAAFADEPDLLADAVPVPAPAAVAEPGPTSDWYLTPSATSRTLGSIGARPSLAPSTGPESRPFAPPATPIAVAPAARPGTPGPNQLVQPGLPGPTASWSGPVLAGAKGPSAAPMAATTTSQKIRVTLASIAAEPKTELAATGLTALGGAFALVSFALPWAPDNGLAVGTVDLQPRPGAWAFDTVAGWPIVLITVLLLAAVLASDKLEEMMPGLAPTIRRLTEAAVPMLLGGFLLGISLLYLTLPWGSGGGIVLLAIGACLLIAGSIVGLFFPAGERRE
jgi:hypothetical protein